jgi:hypothetical protein
MANLLLPRSRRNQVLLILQGAGLGPHISSFKWKEEKWQAGVISVLAFNDVSHEYKFCFNGDGDDFDLYYFPGADLGRVEGEPATWEEVVEQVTEWATAVAGEINILDYWQSPADLAASLFGDSYSKGPDRRFTEPEVEHIRRTASEYRRQLSAQYQLSADQQREIDRRLDFLVREAETQTRQQWLHTAIGIIVSISVAIRPEVGVLAGVVALFASIFASSRKALP